MKAMIIFNKDTGKMISYVTGIDDEFESIQNVGILNFDKSNYLPEFEIHVPCIGVDLNTNMPIFEKPKPTPEEQISQLENELLIAKGVI